MLKELFLFPFRLVYGLAHGVTSLVFGIVFGILSLVFGLVRGIIWIALIGLIISAVCSLLGRRHPFSGRRW